LACNFNITEINELDAVANKMTEDIDIAMEVSKLETLDRVKCAVCHVKSLQYILLRRSHVLLRIIHRYDKSLPMLINYAGFVPGGISLALVTGP